MVLDKIQEKFKEVDEKVKAWIRQQPPAIEVALVTVASAVQGGFIGGLMGNFTSDMAASMPTPPLNPSAALNPEAQQAMKQMQALQGGPWMQARNFAVMTGVNAGINCAVKKIRNIQHDDLQTSMISALGSGMAFSLVSGVGSSTVAPDQPLKNPVASMISTGVVFALFQGAFFQVGQMFSGGAAQKAIEATEYEQMNSMLQSLGLQKYEKNFKKGLLNDRTLHLLNDSALQEVRIPPGPRLVILDHIKRTIKDEDEDWPEDAVSAS